MTEETQSILPALLPRANAIPYYAMAFFRLPGITFIDPQTGLRADTNIFIPSYVITRLR